MISNNTDVTDGWESVIFSRAKSVSNNFTLTCSESSSALWATLHACTCLTPTFAGVEHTPEHGLEKYKELHWLLLSACTAKFVVEQIALPQTVVYCTYSKPLLFKRTSLVRCVGIGEGSMSRWVTRNSAGAAIMFTQTFSRAPGQIYWRALRADCWYNQQLFEWVDEIYQSGREQEAIIPFLLVLLWKLIFKRISNLDICEFKLSIQWL